MEYKIRASCPKYLASKSSSFFFFGPFLYFILPSSSPSPSCFFLQDPVLSVLAACTRRHFSAFDLFDNPWKALRLGAYRRKSHECAPNNDNRSLRCDLTRNIYFSLRMARRKIITGIMHVFARRDESRSIRSSSDTEATIRKYDISRYDNQKTFFRHSPASHLRFSSPF